VTEIPKTECEALVALYDSTNGPGWTNHSGCLHVIVVRTFAVLLDAEDGDERLEAAVDQGVLALVVRPLQAPVQFAAPRVLSYDLGQQYSQNGARHHGYRTQIPF
jgi:hypothetical protein